MIRAFAYFIKVSNDGKLPGALNLGMKQARGTFITWTQDDCWFVDNAIQTMVDYLERHPDIALVYTDYWDVDEVGQQLRYQRVNPPEVLTEQLADDVVRQCFLFRREVWEAIGPQEPRYFPVHEVPWRLEVARRFKIQPLHRSLMSYMVHEHSLTGRIGPWALQRRMVEVLHDAGYMSLGQLGTRLAEIDLGEAYEALIRRGQFGDFQRLALRALLRRPRLARNRGLWKLLALSLSPRRRIHQGNLHVRWQEADAAEQARAAGLDGRDER